MPKVSTSRYISPPPTETGNKEFQRIQQNKDIKVCFFCCRLFKTSNDFIQHMREHDIRSRECHFCPASRTSHNNYAQHIRYMHPEEFNQLVGVEVFITIKVINLAHPCYSCLVSFNTKQQLVNHNKYYHKLKKSTICPVCNLDFTMYLCMQRHFKEKHTQEQYRLLARATGENTANNHQEVNNINNEDQQLSVARLAVQNPDSQHVAQSINNPEDNELTEQDVASLMGDLKKNSSFMSSVERILNPENYCSLTAEDRPSTSTDANMGQNFIENRFNNEFRVPHNSDYEDISD